MSKASIKVSLAILAVMASLGLGGAQPSQATGKALVTVTDKAGAVVEGIEVTLERADLESPADSGESQDSGKMRSAFGQGGHLSLAAAALKGEMKGKSDKEGKVEFVDLKPGRYRASTNNEKGRINAFVAVKVEGGKTVKAALKLPK